MCTRDGVPADAEDRLSGATKVAWPYPTPCNDPRREAFRWLPADDVRADRVSANYSGVPSRGMAAGPQLASPSRVTVSTRWPLWAL